MDFTSLLPYLKFITSSEGQIKFFVFIISITLTAAFIRIWLRKNLDLLNSETIKLIDSNHKITEALPTSNHSIIRDVIERCKSYQEQHGSSRFNTSIIIDQVYSQSKLRIILLASSRDSWDFVCRSFPNVLISLGLFGTFVGITSNLGSIQEVLKVNQGEIIDKLREPLNGMATAFGSSLIALTCGIFLTFINLFFNTTVAKYRFFSSLEDYLNKSIVFDDANTGGILNNIKDSILNFRLEIVTVLRAELANAIGESFASQVSRLITENQKATQNLSESANRFMESSGAIYSSAESFKKAAELISESDLPNSINKFSITIAQATSVFEQTSTSIAGSSEQFHDAMHLLDTYTQDFVKLHKVLSQLMEITQSNQENLLDAMPIIQQERQALTDTVELIRELQSNIESSSKSLDMKTNESLLVQAKLIKLTNSLNTVTEKITDKLYQGLDFDALHNDNQKIIELLEKLTSNSEIISANQLEQLYLFPFNQQINDLVSIVNQISSHISKEPITSNQHDYRFDEILEMILDPLKEVINILSIKTSIDTNPTHQSNAEMLQMGVVNRIEIQILNIEKLLVDINRQIISSFNTGQSKKVLLFPTLHGITTHLERIMGKKIIGK